MLSGRIIVQVSMSIPVTSVGACTSDLHITSYSSTTHIVSRVSAVDRHLSAGSLDSWEILLNLWNGTAALWSGWGIVCHCHSCWMTAPLLLRSGQIHLDVPAFIPNSQTPPSICPSPQMRLLAQCFSGRIGTILKVADSWWGTLRMHVSHREEKMDFIAPLWITSSKKTLQSKVTQQKVKNK